LWYLAVVIACALGMGAKAVMVTAPLMVVIYDWVFVVRGEARRVGCAHHRRWPLYVGLCSTWIILWLCGIGPEVFGKPAGTSHVGFSYQGISPLQYAATQAGVILKYLQLTLWPASLCLVRLPIARCMIFSALCHACDDGVAYRRIGSRSGFFLILAEQVSFHQRPDVRTSRICPWRRGHCRLAGLWIPKQSKSQIANRKFHVGHRLCHHHCPPPISAYATHLRNRIYHSELTMWQDVVTKQPHNARGYVGAGVEMLNAGNHQESIRYFRKALVLKDAYADGHYNLAAALAATGQYAEAANEFLVTVQLNPVRTDALLNAAQSLSKTGDYGRAAQVLGQAIKINPDDGNFHYHLANALADGGDFTAAKASFENALRLKPDHADARINLGNLFCERTTSKKHKRCTSKCSRIIG
jgi:tetratricopeptide (TPR) repeat protein